MKLFTASLCVLLALASAEFTVKTRDDFQQFRKDCVIELNVPASYVDRFKKWEYPNDSIAQCYLKCVFVKFGLFDTATGFNVDNIYTQLYNGKTTAAAATAAADNDEEEKIIREKIAACVDRNEQGSDVCEWAHRGAKCFFEINLHLVQKSVTPAQ